MDDFDLIVKGYIFAETLPEVLHIASSKIESKYLYSDEIYQLLSMKDYGYE